MKNKKIPGVAFYGKVRIPTIGHAEAIDAAKDISKKRGAKLTIGLSHTNAPLNSSQKRTHAEKVFNHPVMTGDDHTKNLFSFLSHLNKHHDDLHLVAGSDRAGKYRSVLEKHNGRADKSGKVPFHFKSWKVHEVEGKREDSDKDPTKMSKDELTRSVSASKLEKLAKEGNYEHFKAYHPGMPESHIKKVYGQVRKGLSLNEEVTRKELAPMLDSFVSFASDKLGIKSMPNIKYKTDDDDYNSFAAYNPSSNELSICTMNRHPMDIFRSVAHELVHHKQNEDGKLGKDIAKEGSTGSDIENEANSEAGKIMRWFAKTNPNMFSKSYVVEEITNSSSGVGIRGIGNVTGNPAMDDSEVSNYISQNIEDTESISSRLHRLIGKNTTDALYSHEYKEPWMDEKDKEEYHTKTLKGIRSQAQSINESINDPGKLKAVFLAGGPGSGKDFVMNKVLAGNGLKEINSDVAFEYLMKKNDLDLEMPAEERLERDILRGRAKTITKEKERTALSGRLGLIINGTADDLEKIRTIKSQLENDGYETMMVFVNTSNEVSRQRNVDRGKSGNRKVPDGTDKQGIPDESPDIRQEKWDLAQKNIGELQKIFGNESFAVIDNTSDIRKVSPEEKEKIETNFNRVRRMTTNFVRTENRNPKAAEWTKAEAQKRGIAQYAPPKAYTYKIKSVPAVIHKPDNSQMEQARRMGLSYYGFGRFGRRVNGVNKVLFHSKGGKLVRVQLNEEQGTCWNGYKQEGMKKKNGKTVPNCVPVEEEKKKMVMSHKGKVKRPLANVDENFEEFMKKSSNREIGTDKLTKIYKKMTPGQEVAEDNVIPRGKFGLPKGGGLGPEFGIQVSPALVTGFANIGNAVYEASKSIQEWALNPKTQQKFAEKYGNLAEQKLIEAALRLEEAGCGCDHSTPKSVKKIKEAWSTGKDPADTLSPIGNQNRDTVSELSLKGYKKKIDFRSTQEKKHASLMDEKEPVIPIKASVAEAKSPSWTRKEGQNPEGGLNRKGVAAYRKANPGSKLSTAVTTPPSKLKKGSKAANRRKSFCARMGGMKKRLTSAKTANDPNSRINKSLRKWNCEE
jgi:hypothetical protein